MDIYTQPGKKVVYNLPNNGYEQDKELALDYLTLNKVYTVKSIRREDSISYVTLKEVHGFEFNTVLFSNKS